MFSHGGRNSDFWTYLSAKPEVTSLAAGLLAGFRHRETMARLTDRTGAEDYGCVQHVRTYSSRRRSLLLQPAGVFYASSSFKPDVCAPQPEVTGAI